MDTMHDLGRIHSKTSKQVKRPDGQLCPISERVDETTGEVKTEIKSPRFYAFNKENYEAKVRLAIQEPLANAILEFFISEMDNTNAICVSMSVLEKIFKMTRQTISKHINILEEKNFIQTYKVGNMNAYAINAYLVFTQGEANLWKAKFHATMYVDYDEQTPKIKAQYAKQIKTK